MKGNFIAFLLLTFSLSNVIAQKKINLSDYTVSLKYHYGFIIQTNEEVAQLINQHPSAVELEVMKRTTGKNYYDQLYKYPQLGAAMQYFIFDPSKPLGNALCLSPTYNLKILDKPKNQLYFRLGYGAAFVEKRFNTYDNYANDAISTRLNFTCSGRINYYFKIKNTDINAGLGITHISNGVTKVPDQGLNLVTVNVGIGISGPTSPRHYNDSIPRFKRKNVLLVSLAGGVNLSCKRARLFQFYRLCFCGQKAQS